MVRIRSTFDFARSNLFEIVQFLRENVERSVSQRGTARPWQGPFEWHVVCTCPNDRSIERREDGCERKLTNATKLRAVMVLPSIEPDLEKMSDGHFVIAYRLELRTFDCSSTQYMYVQATGRSWLRVASRTKNMKFQSLRNSSLGRSSFGRPRNSEKQSQGHSIDIISHALPVVTLCTV